MIILYILAFVFWLALNATVTLEIVLFGLGIVALVAVMVNKMIPKKFNRGIPLSKLFGVVEYLAIVVWEIIVANYGMIKIVLSPEAEEMKPALMTFKTDLKSDISRVALANAITLTPGTITVALNENEYLIHALDVSMLDGIDESIFVEKLRKLEE